MLQADTCPSQSRCSLLRCSASAALRVVSRSLTVRRRQVRWALGNASEDGAANFGLPMRIEPFRNSKDDDWGCVAARVAARGHKHCMYSLASHHAQGLELLARDIGRAVAMWQTNQWAHVSAHAVMD